MKRNNYKIMICSILLPIILVIGLLTIVNTLAKQMTSTPVSDSAKVAEFNIIIIPPEELADLSIDDPLQHTFSNIGQEISFDFRIINNYEVAVKCTPYFGGDVRFSTMVDDIAVESFIVEIGEEVEFTITIISDGLIAETLETNLVINVEQL